MGIKYIRRAAVSRRFRPTFVYKLMRISSADGLAIWVTNGRRFPHGALQPARSSTLLARGRRTSMLRCLSIALLVATAAAYTPPAKPQGPISRRQVLATSLFTIAAGGSPAMAATAEIRKADQSKIGVSRVPEVRTHDASTPCRPQSTHQSRASNARAVSHSSPKERTAMAAESPSLFRTGGRAALA